MFSFCTILLAQHNQYWLLYHKTQHLKPGRPSSVHPITVLQAEMLALKAAIERTNTANEEVNIWGHSESSLQALKFFYVKSRIFQEARMTLLGNARIRLGWVKAHIGIKGNETADTLAKAATIDGTPANIPFPNSYLKNNYYNSPSRVGKLSRIIVRLADRCTAFYRKYQTVALVQRKHPIRHWSCGPAT
ncbi:hypothetical protein AVEN_162690-1 [Araneus ventricosus]|uniref:RNase H type-1 domain-containing protein n=1 Tax=Araneus ventricosus TaxID=182803 RepID=A0A4Y2IDA9_ARAVE|nr:hypothetical protein AVEN_162690-1 [Araneus ventricosus]